MNQMQRQPGFGPAERIGTLGVSEILQITARAAAMQRDGQPVIILGAGEPDFDTPDHIKAAAAQAILEGQTKYTTLDGSARMKQAVCAKFARENGIDCTPAQVTVGAGAKQLLFNAMMATLDPGDQVIIPTPYWTSYSDIVQICGGVPVLVPCDDAAGFRLTAQQLRDAITPRTRWLMLNSPSNPTGAAYGAADLLALAQVLRDAPHVWLLSDEIYEHITYDGFAHVSVLQVAPWLRDRTLVVNGVSKAYAMTGWRIGYGIGPQPLIRAMAVVQSQSTSCPSSVSQAAAIAALEGPQDVLRARADNFRARRDKVVAALNAMPGITCRTPEGAFYTFTNCAGVIGKTTPDGRRIGSDRDFCDWLLDSALVATVPGSAFGLSPYFRISYATSMSELDQALDRIARACASLS